MERADVFISFSGPRSEAAALALKKLLRDVLGGDVSPWTCHDIPPGEPAWPRIIASLKTSKIGVLSVTDESHLAPWVAFEAGPLLVQKRPVVPFLIDNPPTVPAAPWTAFGAQPVPATEAGTLKLVQQIAAVVLARYDDGALRERFARSWPGFDDEVKSPSASTCLSHAAAIWQHARVLDRDVARPFHRWIGARTLRRTDPALEKLSRQPAEHERSALNYVLRVEDLMTESNPMCVFALCGRKGLERQQDEYFGMFLDAKKLDGWPAPGLSPHAPPPGTPSPRRVCRIFVESAPGRLHEESEPVWEEHVRVARSTRAVLPLRIRHDQRKDLDRQYPGIDRQLDEGFGFLILLGERVVCAVLHEGSGTQLQFTVIRKPLVLSELVTFFRFLYRSADGPSTDDADMWRTELDDLAGHFHRRIWEHQ